MMSGLYFQITVGGGRRRRHQGNKKLGGGYTRVHYTTVHF